MTFLFGRWRILTGILLLLILLAIPYKFISEVCYDPFTLPSSEQMRTTPILCKLYTLIQLILLCVGTILTVFGVLFGGLELLQTIWTSCIQRGLEQELKQKGDENV